MRVPCTEDTIGHMKKAPFGPCLQAPGLKETGGRESERRLDMAKETDQPEMWGKGWEELFRVGLRYESVPGPPVDTKFRG